MKSKREAVGYEYTVQLSIPERLERDDIEQLLLDAFLEPNGPCESLGLGIGEPVPYDEDGKAIT